MATNFVQRGCNVTVTAPAALVSGAGVLIGTLFGVAQFAAANGAAVEIATEGVYDLPKQGSQAWSVGDAIYWNGTTGVATTATSSGNVFIGVALAAATSAAATGRVRLNGAMAAAAEA